MSQALWCSNRDEDGGTSRGQDKRGPAFHILRSGVFWPLVHEGREKADEAILFTCLASRAIHLEIANTLMTDSFINALRHFLSLRGPTRQVRSDWESHLVGAKSELEGALSKMDQARIHNFLLEKNCNWFEFKMSQPSASHMGGVWERGIQSACDVLTSLLQSAGKQLDHESLHTFMCEAETMVNSRPLSVGHLSLPSLEPLTPNHFQT